MKLNNTFIPTLIALTATCATSQSLQAQTPARQAFPWSSSTVVQSASPASSQTASPVATSEALPQAPTATFSNPVDQSIASTVEGTTSMANDVLTSAETIYLDEQGNEITREQMQAKLTAGQNDVASALTSASGAVQSVGQNLQERVTPLRSVDNSAWGKAKSVTSKATSFWKKPTLFKTPEGLTLPSKKTTWGKPKFDQPTTWFSRKSQNPITFSSPNSLPRVGQTPTSIDGPLTLPSAQIASRPVSRPIDPINPIAKPSFQNVKSDLDSEIKSIFQNADSRVASEFNSGGDFEALR